MAANGQETQIGQIESKLTDFARALSGLLKQQNDLAN
jgi:hypothetical protein